MAAEMGLSAFQAWLAYGSQRLEGKGVELAEKGLGFAERDLELGEESLRIDRAALDHSRKNMELDREALELARAQHALESRGLGYTSKGVDFAENSLLTAQAELARQREWRLVEEKTQQLKAISNLSALIAGFAMVSLVELSVPDNINSGLLILFGAATALVVCAMVVTMLTTSMMLVYILNFRQVTDQPFKKVWANKCEKDWRRSFTLFKFGVPCFLISLCSLAWIKFQTDNEWADIVVSVSVTTIAVVSLTVWFVYVKTKYATDPEALPDMEDELEPARLKRGVEKERNFVDQLRQRVRRLARAEEAGASREGASERRGNSMSARSQTNSTATLPQANSDVSLDSPTNSRAKPRQVISLRDIGGNQLREFTTPDVSPIKQPPDTAPPEIL